MVTAALRFGSPDYACKSVLAKYFLVLVFLKLCCSTVRESLHELGEVDGLRNLSFFFFFSPNAILMQANYRAHFKAHKLEPKLKKEKFLIKTKEDPFLCTHAISNRFRYKLFVGSANRMIQSGCRTVASRIQRHRYLMAYMSRTVKRSFLLFSVERIFLHSLPRLDYSSLTQSARAAQPLQDWSQESKGRKGLSRSNHKTFF